MAADPQATIEAIPDLIEDVRTRLTWVPPNHAEATFAEFGALEAAVVAILNERDVLVAENTRYRTALEAIAAHPYPGILVNIAKRALAGEALSDG